MKLHHIGIACQDIDKSLLWIKKIFDVTAVSEIVFDKEQNVHLCLIKTNNNVTIELILGITVNSLIKKGVSYYHICFTVKDIFSEIKRLKETGAILVSPPKPAILFNNKLVAFFYTHFGLIKLLESS